jgi:hypothetical protein
VPECRKLLEVSAICDTVASINGGDVFWHNVPH